MLQRGTFVFTRQKYKKLRIQRHKSPYTESFCKYNIELNCFSGFLVTGGRTRSTLFCRFSCFGKVGVVNPFFPASLLPTGKRGQPFSAAFLVTGMQALSTLPFRFSCYGKAGAVDTVLPVFHGCRVILFRRGGKSAVSGTGNKYFHLHTSRLSLFFIKLGVYQPPISARKSNILPAYSSVS